MKTLTIETKQKLDGKEYASETIYEGEGRLDADTALPAGVAAEIATKTDANTATVTLPEGHVLTDGNFNVFWGTASVRYGVPGTIVANTLSLDGGAGNDFPVAETAVVVSKQVVITASLTGNLLVAMTRFCTKRAHVDFQTAADASIFQAHMAERKLVVWADDLGMTNPLADQVVAKILASCGDSTEAGDLTIPLLYDAVA